MTAPWLAYQLEVAALFQSLGCTVEVEKEMAGARATHAIDVLARTTVGGIPVTWVIECKLWNTAIPKEKVLALSQIAADVGADRAFLLSESGFQPGAIRAAQNTNITLTSRQDLLDSAGSEIERRELQSLAQRAHGLQRELHELYVLDDGSPGPPPGMDRETFVDLLANVFELHAMALPKAQVGDFPITLSSVSAVFPNPSAFIPTAARELDRVAACVAAAKVEVERVRDQAGSKFNELTSAIHDFMSTSEATLSSIRQGKVEQADLATALDHMKRVGARAEELRALLGGKALRALSKVMRTLFDGPYVHLAQGNGEADQWRRSRELIEASISALAATMRTPTATATPQT